MGDSPAAAADAANAPVDSAPTWRRQPYRLFFPLGFLHLWAGLSPWLLTALGLKEHETKVYHSIAQIQGFMLCFALGFLFTMIPRRTRTEAPSRVEMLVGLTCPALITTCAAFDLLAASQTFWFVLVAMLALFVRRRLRGSSSENGPLPSFVWLPMGMFMGLVGSVLFGVYGALGPVYYRVHELAQLLLLQGLFLSLVVGVGSMVIPLFTRGEGSSSRPSPPGARVVHVFVAVLLVGTFFLEVWSDRAAGYLTRAFLCATVMVWAGGIHRPPTLPGANRLLVWVAAWMIPMGYALAGLLPPEQFQSGLHLVFIGGFATMAFAVAAHVALAHGGKKHVLAGWPWQIVGYGGLFFIALAARVLMQVDPPRYMLWMGIASGTFLLGSLMWAALVLPVLARRPA
jgi:uncharacterized protein involved in response to NO